MNFNYNLTYNLDIKSDNIQKMNIPNNDNNNKNENSKLNNQNNNYELEKEMIKKELINKYNLKIEEIIKEKDKEKEANLIKIHELEDLLTNEQNKNSKLINELSSLKLYSEELNKNINLLKETKNSENNQNKIRKKNIFTPQLFIKLFYKINQKFFSSSEYKKYVNIYNSKDIYKVYEEFKKTCEILKKKVYETHFGIDTSNTNTDIDENLLNNSRRAFINNSYKSVNERILKLKKFEFDIINLNEFIKNYFVSQEIAIQIIFTNNGNIIQFEIIEKLFKLLEECLNFKIDEMNDNVIFLRKLLITFLKSQKNCLGLSLEFLSSK